LRIADFAAIISQRYPIEVGLDDGIPAGLTQCRGSGGSGDPSLGMCRFDQGRDMMLRILLSVLASVLVGCLAGASWAATKSIGKDGVMVRSGPSLDHQVVFRASLGYPVEIKEKKGDWVLIRDWEGDTGWVFEPMISEIRTAVIRTEGANIRSAPSTDGDVRAKARKGEIFKILDRKDNWLKLGYYHDGVEVGWIRQDLVFGE
jgi:SH3-like domain-containing protein